MNERDCVIALAGTPHSSRDGKKVKTTKRTNVMKNEYDFYKND